MLQILLWPFFKGCIHYYSLLIRIWMKCTEINIPIRQTKHSLFWPEKNMATKIASLLQQLSLTFELCIFLFHNLFVPWSGWPLSISALWWVHLWTHSSLPINPASEWTTPSSSSWTDHYLTWRRLEALLVKESHPLQVTVTALGSSFSNRLIHPKCVKERYRPSCCCQTVKPALLQIGFFALTEQFHIPIFIIIQQHTAILLTITLLTV